MKETGLASAVVYRSPFRFRSDMPGPVMAGGRITNAVMEHIGGTAGMYLASPQRVNGRPVSARRSAAIVPIWSCSCISSAMTAPERMTGPGRAKIFPSARSRW